MEAFAKTPEGDSWISEWGDQAPRRFAKVTARVTRVFAKLTAKEASDLEYFVNHLSGPEFRAVVSNLAR